MAFNVAERLTLSGLEEPTPQTNNNKEDGLKRRIYRRYCKSASLADSVFQKANGTAPTLQYEFNFAKLEPAYRQVGILFGIYMVVGTLCFYFLPPDFKGEETTGLVDSIYYVASTMTTVGNGDLVPDNRFTKLLSSIFAFIGMGLVGLVMDKTGEFLAAKQERILVKAIHMHHKVSPNEFEKELEANLVVEKRIVISIVTSRLLFVVTIYLL